MQAQHGLIHHAGQQKDFLNLFLTWHFPSLILEGNGDLGFEETLLLLFLFQGGYRSIVAKLISAVRFRTIDFFTGFAPSD
jgi:hypothetical protein